MEKTWESFPHLSENIKEFISLGVWSLYRIQDKLVLVIPGGCQCCHGGRPTRYYLLNEEGLVQDAEREAARLYQQGPVQEIIKFKIPERITRNYLHIKL